MGGGRLFFHVKLNFIDPCRTIRDSTTVEGCQAGGLGHQFLYMCEYDAEIPKQGKKRFNSIVNTINFSYLPAIALIFWYQIKAFSEIKFRWHTSQPCGENKMQMFLKR